MQLEARDGEFTAADTLQIVLYADACEHAKNQEGFVLLPGDINEDCIVNEQDQVKKPSPISSALVFILPATDGILSIRRHLPSLPILKGPGGLQYQLISSNILRVRVHTSDRSTQQGAGENLHAFAEFVEIQFAFCKVVDLRPFHADNKNRRRR